MLRSAELSYSQKIPIVLIIMVAFAVHAPLLLMQVPANSFDAHFHMSMAEHYAHHWFDPWNLKSLAGFSQTTYPPLTQQWIALLSNIFGLTNAYLIFQLIIIMLLPLAVFGFAKLWVNERAASYAALGSVFLGTLCLLVYQDGQIGTTTSTTLFLFAIPFFHAWVVHGRYLDFLKALVIGLTAAAAHHATLLFGSFLFIIPVIWRALQDYKETYPEKSRTAVIRRVAGFFVVSLTGVLIILMPYFLALLKNPITQIPIPHQSRVNFLLQPIWGVHYWLLPCGLGVLAFPYIFWKGGTDRKLRPLFCGFYVAMLFGIGGTTPIPKLILQRAFNILTFERFNFWVMLLALPFIGMLACSLIDRYKKKAAVLLVFAAVATASIAAAWNFYFPLIGPPLDVSRIVDFMNRPEHNQYRYLTLGFGNALSELAAETTASSVDGEYNSGRTLPEMTKYGSGQLSSAKYYGTPGIESLTAMLKHSERYGLKYVFVHDSYYEPLLSFAGWRQIDSYNQGEITVWTTIGIPPAHEMPSDARPPVWQGIMWGTLPMGTSILAMVLMVVWSKPYRKQGRGEREQERLTVIPLEAPEELEPAPTGTAPVVRQKICLVSAFPPSRGDLNEYGFHIARALNANPHVDLTVLADTMPAPKPELEGFKVVRCWKFNSLGNILRVLGAVRKAKPDVVWFNIGLSTLANKPLAAFLSTTIPALCRFFGYNTHITLHAFFENVDLADAQVSFPALYRMGGTLATRVLLMANGVHVLLPSYKTTLVRKYKTNPARIHVHSHGVFSWEIQEPTPVAGRHRVLAFGSWGTYKRLESLLEAFTMVQKQVPGAELVIAGGDHPKARGYIASLRERCKDNRAIQFLGYVPESDLPAVFRSATVAVLPYNSGAGSSGVAHVASEYGLPIVASDLPDFVEMAQWERLAVEFYPRGQANALAAALLRVLQSPELCAQMARQNAAAAAGITFDRVVGEYLESFQAPAKIQLQLDKGSQPMGEERAFEHGLGHN